MFSIIKKLSKVFLALGGVSCSSSSFITNEQLKDELKQYSDITNISSFSVYEEKLKLKNHGSTDKVKTSFFSSDRGVHLIMAEDFSYIAFEYTFEFTVNGERYSLKHYAKLDDWKTIPGVYEDFHYERGDRTKHDAYDNFRKINLWTLSRLLEKFDLEFNQNAGFVSTIGDENLDKLKEYLTFIVQADYI